MSGRRRNPFPGVTRAVDRHGRVRWRFRRAGVSCYLPGPYASADFRAAYEAALAETDGRRARPAPARGTLAWLIEDYLASPRFRRLAEATRAAQRRQFDWLRQTAGDLPFARFEARHVAALMDMRAGPCAANTVAKRASTLFNYARRLGLMSRNPAAFVERRAVTGDGFATWSPADIAAFRARHPEGSKARLALELALNTGAARQDLARLGWQNLTGGRIRYRRGKTGVEADLPILPELAAELRHVPRDRLIFLATKAGAPHTAAGFGGWFSDRCAEAGLRRRSVHGLRKAGAARLAEAGASEFEIAAFLAHASPRMAALYVRAARRARLADAAFARLGRGEGRTNVSNLAEGLDISSPQAIEGEAKNA